MACLNVLGHGAPFWMLPMNTHISSLELLLYFGQFVNMYVQNRDEYIYLPRDKEELEVVMQKYADVGLPGAMGSVDVVHCKWSKCPAGDFNRAKGNEGYPTLAFQCISDYNRRITAVFGPQWGTQNYKHILKIDPMWAQLNRLGAIKVSGVTTVVMVLLQCLLEHIQSLTTDNCAGQQQSARSYMFRNPP
jgi:hypothetical protein